MQNLGVSGRWLRHVKDGTIYNYTETLAKNPVVVEVSEEIAFPGKNIPAKQQGRTAKVDLKTDEKVVAKTKPRKRQTKPELAADAAKGI